MLNPEKLIELVRTFPILYDLAHKNYKNTRKNDKLWGEIEKELNESAK